MEKRKQRRADARTPWFGCRFDPQPGSRHPFARANALAMEMRGIFDKGLSPVDRQLELNALPEYTSRGHGGKHRPKSRVIGGQWSQDRSKYAPGCGAR